jgi:hypothetical protein
MWEKLEQINIENKEKYVQVFKDLISQIKENNFDFKDKETKDYYIINKGKFVYIVPRELIYLFNEMKSKAPNEFLGFTILINDVRVSCFGIPCSELTKAIIK